MVFCDAHSHLHFSEFEGSNLAENLMVCLASASSEDMSQLVLLKKKNPEKIFAAFGFHPKYLNSFSKDELVKFLDIADAVGEIGFDKFSKFDLSIQTNCFEEQVCMAISKNLPIVIHEVGFWNELEKSLKKLRPKKFLIHAAKCSVELVKKFEAMGGWFSFGERELNLTSGRLALMAANKNRILIETDLNSDFEKLKKTYKCVAEILNLKEIELCKLIEENFLEFFKNG